jgi:CHASE3 domain sensor protein
MSSATEPVDIPVGGTLQQFNRYGLPGLVIGALLMIIVAMMYFGIGFTRDTTRAITEMTGTIRELTQAIRDMKE